jgi:hypothetical protein
MPGELGVGRARRGCPAGVLLLLLVLSLASLGVHSSTVLSKGVSRNGVVSANATKFYKLQLSCPDTAAALLLTLTPLQGDPDLYLSSTVQQPGPVTGADQSLVGNATQLVVQFPSAGMYYLGVYGNTSAAFKLQATVQLATGEWI